MNKRSFISKILAACGAFIGVKSNANEKTAKSIPAFLSGDATHGTLQDLAAIPQEDILWIPEDALYRGFANTCTCIYLPTKQIIEVRPISDGSGLVAYVITYGFGKTGDVKLNERMDSLIESVSSCKSYFAKWSSLDRHDVAEWLKAD